ncbi:uncharacterized protein DNG_10348 [Cephalotrichum gorgonifer]|uniref:Mediator of RNA polymerase II transcription subunit 8 n=1 Tax=Cephalotrichum gorgonifer TaxID=2041049 RepID=A0AAE8N8U0_9PEZI|nr:uncharacterized protein DNG_10348 [Cephalotrichum gorgonifer]
MASLNLSMDEVKVLESIRQRLTQVVSSLQKFKDDVAIGQPLPPASSIQASSTIIQQNLRTLTTYLSENSSLLERVAVHPATNFPGRQQENVLLQLLRKKPEPDVEELLARGRDTAAGLTSAASGTGGDAGDAWTEQRELWAWARRYCDERIGQYAMEETHQVYTAEERAAGLDTVRTGLRKGVDEQEDESEDEDEEGGAEAKETVPDEVRRVARLKLVRDAIVGRFELPPNADWESKRKLGMAVRGR